MDGIKLLGLVLDLFLDLSLPYLMACLELLTLLATSCCSHRQYFLVVLGMMGLYIMELRTLPFNTDPLFLEHAVDKLEKCTNTCGNTVDIDFCTYRILGCSKLLGTLNRVSKVTSNEYKEQYLHYKLCASLK